MKIKINKKLTINPRKPPLIIAEVSANHCGKKSLFLDHIKSAAKNGADLIKIQTYEPEDITVENNKYKFVHLDVDLYKPTLESLDYVFDKIIENGILITDDYETPLFPGNKKAWEEFLSIRDIPFFVLPSGQAVIIKK